MVPSERVLRGGVVDDERGERIVAKVGSGGPSRLPGAAPGATVSAPVKLDGIDTPELRASASLVGVVARVSLVGTADATSKGALDQLLKRVHARCVNMKTEEVTVDIRALQFMDSSCFKAFVTWVSAVRDLDARLQYKLAFLSDSTKHWQKRSLGALACFAVDLVTIIT
jgi:hypothetical protein